MEQNRDGSFLFTREELLNDNIIVASKVYPLAEHQFYILIQNGDTRADIFAGKIFYIALGVAIQILVYLCFVCYYHLNGDIFNVNSTLSHIDKYQIIFLFLCFIICGVSKFIAKHCNSERKQLISDIMSHFNKKR